MQDPQRAATADHDAACGVCGALRDAVPEAVTRTGLADLTIADLARTAGIATATAADHSPDGVLSHVLAAYLATGERLSQVFERAVHAAPTWDDGVRDGFRVLADEYARDPEVAAFCLVEILRGGDRELQRARIGLRQGSVEMLARERRRRHASPERVGDVQLELLLGVVNGRMNAIAAEGRIAELPEALEEVLQVTRLAVPLAA